MTSEALRPGDAGSPEVGVPDARPPGTSDDPATGTGTDSGGTGRRAGAGPVATSLAGFAASRLLLLVAWALAQGSSPRPLAQVWDGGWFLGIAAHGYPAGPLPAGPVKSEWAFLPLYPLVVRGAGAVGLPLDVAALVVVLVLGVVLAVLVAHLATALVGAEHAGPAALLFWFFPGSAVLSLAYSEALFLVLVCGALLALHRRAWVVAGVLSALAGATRASGLALVLACAVAAAAALVAGRRPGAPGARTDRWALAAPALAPLGLLAFVVHGRARTGDWLVWQHAQQGWGQRFDLGLRAPGSIRAELFRGGDNGVTWILTLATGALLLAALVLVARRPGPGLPLWAWAYVGGSLVILLSSTGVLTRPRFVLALVPLFAVVAARLSRRAAAVVTTVLAAALPVVAYLYLAAPHVIP